MEEAKEVKKPYSRRTTLKELGNNLPVIRKSATGELIKNRSFTFLEWTMETEEKIASFQEKAQNTGLLVNFILRTLLDEFCGQSFQDMPDEQKALIINQLEFPNVMYMYMYLRYEEMGNEYNVGNVGCPTCKKLNENFVADLGTLEIDVKDKDHQREHLCELKRPIVVDGKDPITGLKIDVTKWDVLERADPKDAANSAKLKMLMLQSAICGASTAKGPIEGFVDSKTLIKKMKKIDIERCVKELAANNGGPVAAVGGKCIHCEVEFIKPLDWSYDHFFGSSSL